MRSLRTGLDRECIAFQCPGEDNARGKIDPDMSLIRGFTHDRWIMAQLCNMRVPGNAVSKERGHQGRLVLMSHGNVNVPNIQQLVKYDNTSVNSWSAPK